MKLHINLKEHSYDIILQHGALAHVGEYADLHRNVMIVCDTGVPKEYIDMVAKQCTTYDVHILEQGENTKRLAVFEELCHALLKRKYSRKDCIIALGGGVVGDVTGFVAASYMRGIDFIQIPTTTLSQIDSSIGGKVAINLGGVKNIVGAFYQPKLVVIDPDTLQTLSKRHYNNGLVEALKAGLIYDKELFELFETGDIYANIDTILYKALCVKRAIVEQDEKEENLRKVLNFGHTIGHAIESYYHLHDYLHGECVAMGMLYFIDDDDLKKRYVQILKRLHIPSKAPYDGDQVYDVLCRDKKADKGMVSIVHVKTLGKAQLVETPLCDVRAIVKGAAT